MLRETMTRMGMVWVLSFITPLFMEVRMDVVRRWVKVVYGSGSGEAGAPRERNGWASGWADAARQTTCFERIWAAVSDCPFRTSRSRAGKTLWMSRMYILLSSL